MKREAKLSIHNTKPHAVLVTLVMVAVILILQVLTMALNGDIEAIRATLTDALDKGIVDGESLMTGIYDGTIQAPVGNGAVGFGGLLTLAIEIMTMVLGVGYSLYALRVSRRIKASVGDIFDAFGLFFRAILVSMVPGFLVSLWMCIYIFPASALLSITGSPVWMLVCLPLVIPALKAAYSYRQAVFILVDNPNLRTMEAIALSKAAMEGHRMELFKLDLSFLGWQILQLLVLPVYLWLLPYMRVTQAHYYAYVMGDFAARTGYVPHFGDAAPRADAGGEGTEE